MLHLPDNALPRGHQFAQHAQLVHRFQRVIHAVATTQKIKAQRATGIGVKCVFWQRLRSAQNRSPQLRREARIGAILILQTERLQNFQ